MKNVGNSKSLPSRLYAAEKFFSRMLSFLNVSGTFLKKLHQLEFCENLIIHAKLKGFMQDRIRFSKKFTYISLFQDAHKNVLYPKIRYFFVIAEINSSLHYIKNKISSRFINDN